MLFSIDEATTAKSSKLCCFISYKNDCRPVYTQMRLPHFCVSNHNDLELERYEFSKFKTTK